MFKYAGSRSPTAQTGTDFQGDDGQVSEEKVANFIANHTTSYKILNRLQLEYRVSEDGFAFNGAPKIRHSASAYGARTVGLTKNPCGSLAGFADIFDTQQGYADMKTFSQTENFWANQRWQSRRSGHQGLQYADRQRRTGRYDGKILGERRLSNIR